jgi:hypothetical protein
MWQEERSSDDETPPQPAAPLVAPSPARKEKEKEKDKEKDKEREREREREKEREKKERDERKEAARERKEEKRREKGSSSSLAFLLFSCSFAFCSSLTTLPFIFLLPTLNVILT